MIEKQKLNCERATKCYSKKQVMKNFLFFFIFAPPQAITEFVLVIADY